MTDNSLKNNETKSKYFGRLRFLMYFWVTYKASILITQNLT